MFFWLVETDKCDLNEVIEQGIEAFETLGLAGYSRTHIVLGDRGLMKALAGSGLLSRRSQQYFKYVFSRYSDLAVLRRRFDPVFIGRSSFDVNRIEKISVGLDFFSSPASCGQAVLLAEHVFDYKLIRALAKGWIAKNGLASACDVSFRFAAGGGGGTGHVLSVYELDGTSIGCCVVDSDKDHVDANVGNTAEFCINMHSESWRWALHVIEGREIENLIPNCLLEAAVPGRVRANPVLYSDECWSLGGYSDHKIADSLCRFLRVRKDVPRVSGALAKLGSNAQGRLATCCGSGKCGEGKPICNLTEGSGGVLQAVVGYIEKRGITRRFSSVSALEAMLRVVVSTGLAPRMSFA